MKKNNLELVINSSPKTGRDLIQSGEKFFVVGPTGLIVGPTDYRTAYDVFQSQFVGNWKECSVCGCDHSATDQTCIMCGSEKFQTGSGKLLDPGRF